MPEKKPVGYPGPIVTIQDGWVVRVAGNVDYIGAGFTQDEAVRCAYEHGQAGSLDLEDARVPEDEVLKYLHRRPEKREPCGVHGEWECVFEKAHS